VAEKDAEFARVVATHRAALLRYGLRRLDDHTAAEDLVAETFVVVWRRWDALPSRDEELFWLYGIAGRLEGHLAFERELDQETPRYSKEDVEELMEALGALTADEQELIQLFYWEKLTHREIGLVLKCSEKAAGIRLSRARKRLRDLLNGTPAQIVTLSHLREEGLR
jgi:DNA-directed RNA polymerase specialized sigma24 family protein